MKFKEGDIVVCVRDNDYNFTLNKEYIILEYEDEVPEPDIGGFIWPSYVKVRDDLNNVVQAHSSRFVLKSPSTGKE